MIKKYKALKEFSLGPEEARVSYETGAEFEWDDEVVHVQEFVDDGSVEEVFSNPPATVQYMVIKGPVSNPEAEIFQEGNVMSLPEGDVFATDMVTAGFIELKSVYDARPKNTEATVPQTPITPVVVDGAEPRKRYRGKIVVDEYSRTVGTQTFKHIRTEEGHEYDLTQIEYNGEVHVSYPL